LGPTLSPVSGTSIPVVPGTSVPGTSVTPTVPVAVAVAILVIPASSLVDGILYAILVPTSVTSVTPTVHVAGVPVGGVPAGVPAAGVHAGVPVAGVPATGVPATGVPAVVPAAGIPVVVVGRTFHLRSNPPILPVVDDGTVADDETEVDQYDDEADD